MNNENEKNLIDKEFVLKNATSIITQSLKLNSYQSMIVMKLLTNTFEDIELESSKNMLITTEISNINIIKNFCGCKTLAGLSQNSIEQYVRSVTKMSEFIGKPLHNVSTNDIRRYLLYYQKSVTNTTVDNCRRNIRVFYQFMEDEHYIEKNPCRRIEKIKEEQKYKRFYTDMEIESMRDACRNIKELALIDLLCSTGMRVNEVANLKLSDFDWDKRIVLVHGKGKKDRIIPFTTRCKKHLIEYIDSRVDNKPYLFPSRIKNREKSSNSAINDMVHRIGYRIDLYEITVHCFRRWLASDLNKKGMDSRIIQEIMGHSSFSITKKHYINHSIDRIIFIYNSMIS